MVKVVTLISFLISIIPFVSHAAPAGGSPLTPPGDTLNVLSFGAKGNDTIDDSKAFQKAIDAAAQKQAPLLVPAGTFYIKDVELRSNTNIVGRGEQSILQKIFSGEFGLGCNFSYLHPVSDPLGKLNVKNISISNLAFAGTSTTDGFSQYRHLLNLNGVENVQVNNCWFKAFNGDGIYLGSDVGVERHNRDVTISNCIFDGKNKENRNGISVIDGTRITIENNRFFNCSRPDMPGAIDVEPDAFAFHRVQDIAITGNYFKDIGGNVGTISLVAPLSQTQMVTPVQNITISKNHLFEVANGIALFQNNLADANTLQQKITVNQNLVNNSRGYPLAMYGIGGATISDNIFNQFVVNVIVGIPAKPFQCYNILFKNNLVKNNTGNGVAIALGKVDGFASLDNTFENIGLKNGRYGIVLLGETNGQTSNIRSQNDIVIGDNTTSFSEINPGHVTRQALNEFLPSRAGRTYKNFFPFKKQ